MIREVWQACFGQDVTAAKKSGPNQYRVLCPFHSEKSPSCDVEIVKNVFTCRSCEAHGGYLDVVVLAGNAANRREAHEWLERHGVRL